MAFACLRAMVTESTRAGDPSSAKRRGHQKGNGTRQYLVSFLLPSCTISLILPGPAEVCNAVSAKSTTMRSGGRCPRILHQHAAACDCDTMLCRFQAPTLHLDRLFQIVVNIQEMRQMRPSLEVFRTCFAAVNRAQEISPPLGLLVLLSLLFLETLFLCS